MSDTLTMPSQQAIEINVNQLDFDPQNPRFFDILAADHNTEEAALKRMLREENLEELVGSIGQQGFFPGEPLLVAPNPGAAGRYLVVEGNRRLAALRVLANMVPTDQLPGSLQDLNASATYHPTSAPCFVFPSRREVLKYLGFRHISGPRRWEPLAKARYLADLIRNFYSDLPLEDQLRCVARDIGSRRDYVAQSLTALNLYERARQAQFYGLQRVGEEDISFSLLTTALSYSPIVKFLGLPKRDAVIVDAVNDDHARELLGWMFAQDQRGDTVLGESRRLKSLAAVVDSPRAVVELRKSNNLDQAYVFTSGPGEAFGQRLETAELAISDSLGLISALEPEDRYAKQVERIIVNAENLLLLIQRSITQRTRRARQAQAEDGTDA